MTLDALADTLVAQSEDGWNYADFYVYGQVREMDSCAVSYFLPIIEKLNGPGSHLTTVYPPKTGEELSMDWTIIAYAVDMVSPEWKAAGLDIKFMWHKVEDLNVHQVDKHWYPERPGFRITWSLARA